MKNGLVHSDEKQQAAETQTQAVLDFTEGIGIIKTYNLLGEKSKELTDSFETNSRVHLDFEFSHHPYKRGVYLIYGIGTVVMLALFAFLYANGFMRMKPPQAWMPTMRATSRRRSPSSAAARRCLSLPTGSIRSLMQSIS